MALDVTDLPGADPTGRRRRAGRHGRRRHRPDLAALAERSWRPPLVLAVVLFAVCGPAHALGHTDLVYYLVLGALAASAVAVPLGLVGLRHAPPVTGAQGGGTAADQAEGTGREEAAACDASAPVPTGWPPGPI